MAKTGLFVVVGEFTIDPRDRPALVEALLANRRQTLASEPGVRTYEACVTESDDQDKIFMVEIYDSRAAFEAHLQTDHFKVWNESVGHLIKDTKSHFLHRLLY